MSAVMNDEGQGGCRVEEGLPPAGMVGKHASLSRSADADVWRTEHMLCCIVGNTSKTKEKEKVFFFYFFKLELTDRTNIETYFPLCRVCLSTQA